MSKLLLDEYPIPVLPSLAINLGLNGAIVVQQVHFLTNTPKCYLEIDGERWVHNSYTDWQMKYFPWWSSRTVERIFYEMENGEFIISRQQESFDRSKLYRVHYAKMAEWNTTYWRGASPQNDEPSIKETQETMRFKAVMEKLDAFMGSMNIQTAPTIDGWIAVHKDEWIFKAIELAKKNGARSIKYIDKILLGWEETGYPQPKKDQNKEIEAAFEEYK